MGYRERGLERGAEGGMADAAAECDEPEVMYKAAGCKELLVVVRCGGGFVDFADFARRHGSREKSLLQRRAEARAAEVEGGVLRLNTARQNGKLRVTELPAGCGRNSATTGRSSLPMAPPAGPLSA